MSDAPVFASKPNTSRTPPTTRNSRPSRSSRERCFAARSCSAFHLNRLFMDNTALKLIRDCEAVQIPIGNVVTLSAGTLVDITQTLGGNYTVQAPGGLFRIAAKDSDALGVAPSRSLMEEVCLKPESTAGPVEEKLVW